MITSLKIDGLLAAASLGFVTTREMFTLRRTCATLRTEIDAGEGCWLHALRRDFLIPSPREPDLVPGAQARARWHELAQCIYPTVPLAAYTVALRFWAEIEAWAAVHLPALLRTLRRGASNAEIERLERQLGSPLPASLKALYRVHDGQAVDRYFNTVNRGILGLFGGVVVYDNVHIMQLLPLKEVSVPGTGEAPSGLLRISSSLEGLGKSLWAQLRTGMVLCCIRDIGHDNGRFVPCSPPLLPDSPALASACSRFADCEAVDAQFWTWLFEYAARLRRGYYSVRSLPQELKIREQLQQSWPAAGETRPPAVSPSDPHNLRNRYICTFPEYGNFTSHAVTDGVHAQISTVLSRVGRSRSVNPGNSSFKAHGWLGTEADLSRELPIRTFPSGPFAPEMPVDDDFVHATDASREKQTGVSLQICYRVRLWLTTRSPHDTVQLHSRHWLIRSGASDEPDEVRGSGVIGLHPILHRCACSADALAGRVCSSCSASFSDARIEVEDAVSEEGPLHFEYASQTVLENSEYGTIEGSFRMVPGSLEAPMPGVASIDAIVARCRMGVPDFIFSA